MPLSENLEKRLRNYFRFLDVNSNGLVRKEDTDLLWKNLCQLHNASSEESELLLQETGQWWGKLEPLAVNGELTEDHYTEFMGQLLEGGLEKSREELSKTLEAVFDIIDWDKDKRISLEEFNLYYLAFNVSNTDNLKAIFSRIDLDQDGFVTSEEWMTANLHFFTRDDPSFDDGFLYDVQKSQPTTGFTSNLEERIRMYFKFLDVNNDNVISKRDLDLLMSNMCRLYNADQEERDKIQQETDQWWAKMEPLAVDGEMTEDGYVGFIKHLFEEGVEKVRTDFSKTLEDVFHMIDRDNDNRISMEEFTKYYLAVNVFDKANVEEIFSRVDLNQDGFVTVDEWITANLNFFTRDDPNFDDGFLYDVQKSHESTELTSNLEERVRMYFKFLDVNNDNVINKRDVDLLTGNICRLYNADQEERDKIQQETDLWWAKMEPLAVDGEMTEDGYVGFMKQLFDEGVEKMRTEFSKTLEDVFHMIDRDNDNRISMEEFTKYYLALNFSEKEKVEEIFSRVDLNQDGFVTVDEWILANLNFFTRDDPNFDEGYLYDVQKSHESTEFTSNLEERIRMYFKFLDVNNDKVISKRDLDLIMGNMCRLYNADQEERDKIQQETDLWWAKMEPLAVDGEMTEDGYVGFIKHLFDEGVEKMRTEFSKTLEDVFQMIDRDNDNRISMEEFTKYYLAVNVSDKANVEEVFSRVDLNQDGFVTVDEWITANLNFFTRDDANFDDGFLYDVQKSRQSAEFTSNLEERIRMYFKFLDVNNDNVINKRDVDLLTGNVCRLYNADQQERDKIQQEMDQWWAKMEPLAVDGEMTEDGYVGFMKQLFEEGVEKMRTEFSKTFEDVFHMIDRDNDNRVSMEEFTKYYLALNFSEKEKVEEIFSQVDLNQDGFVTVDEWITANLNFFTRDDANFDDGFLYDVQKSRQSAEFTSNLEERIRMYFKFLDVNNDNVINKRDVDLLTGNVCRLYNADQQERDKIEQEMDQWWAKMEPLAVDDEMTEDGYVGFMKQLFDEGVEKMRSEFSKTFEDVFHMIDRDNDNRVSMEEFTKYYLALNFSEKEKVEEIFSRVDLNQDGFVTVDEWISANLNFFTRDDPNFDDGFLYDVQKSRQSAEFTSNLEERIRMYFKFLDVNNDNLINKRDVDLLTGNICRLYNADQQERDKIQQEMDHWWAKMEPLAVDGEMTEDNYVGFIKHLFDDGVEKMRSEFSKTFEDVFHMIDRDNDNRISMEEFTKYYMALNFSEKEKVKEIFSRVDLNQDGFVTVDEWISANLNFFTRDDPNFDDGYLYDVQKSPQTSNFTRNLEGRLRMYFKFLDTNNDNVICKKDADELTDNLCRMNSADQEERDKIQQESDHCWVRMEPLAVDGELTEDGYINYMKQLFDGGIEELRTERAKWFEAVFNLMDRDKDKRVSIEEFTKYYLAFNVTDSEELDEIFARLDSNQDGFVSIDEWITANLNFFTRDDPNIDDCFLYNVQKSVIEEETPGILTQSLETRFRKFFKFVDINTDKVLNKQDADLLLANICRNHKAIPDEQDKLQSVMEQWATRLEHLTMDGWLSEGIFIDFFHRLYHSGMEKLKRDIKMSFDAVFDMMDRDKDGLISIDEFKKFYSAFSIHDKAKLAKIFRRLDKNGDGHVTANEWVSANVNFFTRDEPGSDDGFLYDVKRKKKTSCTLL